MDSTFNPDTFLNTETTEGNSTEFVPVPEGEYNGAISAIKPRSTDSGAAILDVTYDIDDAEAAEVTGIKIPKVRQSIFLDITEQGGLDMGKGKNVQLGKLREAIGQNTAGKPWQPGMLIGQVARITVKHREWQGAIFADVKGVAALA